MFWFSKWIKLPEYQQPPFTVTRNRNSLEVANILPKNKAKVYHFGARQTSAKHDGTDKSIAG